MGRRRKNQRKRVNQDSTKRLDYSHTRIILVPLVMVVSTFLFMQWNRKTSTGTHPKSDTNRSHATEKSPLDINLTMNNQRRDSSVVQFFTEMALEERPRIFQWFGGIPEKIKTSRLDVGKATNIRRVDYVGAEECKECHRENYNKWSKHPHRWMNAWATTQNLRGDFSGSATIHYMGGVGSFYRENGVGRMKLERSGMKRVYEITRTIGSRFFQYYTGKLIDGPETSEHVVRHVDHLLPFGYWFEQKEWVPTVNIEEEMPDSERIDPFAEPSRHQYDRVCSECHTTRPTGDLLLNIEMMHRFDAYSPRILHFAAEDYLNKEHPQLLRPLSGHPRLSRQQMFETISKVRELPAKSHAVNLGISCEGCHNGCASHVNDERKLPAFFPESPDIYLEKGDKRFVLGRNSVNANWVCSRCHAGNRVRYAAGISTWNSTEYSDASRGGCYDPNTAGQRGMQHLTCVHCHDPHEAIGQSWRLSDDQDDTSCLSCHDRFSEPKVRAAHTHHKPGSQGDRCMNCHMPRINEGLQDIVRTHTIFSPTEPRMIEANHPNACNLCHVKETIDWTLKHLKDWYQADGFSGEKIALNYPDRKKPVAIGWLNSQHHGTRLVAADALIRANARWAIGELLQILDDPFLVNRQFTSRGLANMYGIDLRDFGYRFYMFQQERAEPLERIRRQLIDQSPQAPSP